MTIANHFTHSCQVLTSRCHGKNIISIKFYFEIYSIINNFGNSYHLYCFCLDIPGCADELKRRHYCLICQFYFNNHHEDLEKLKKDPIELVKLYSKTKSDLAFIKGYDSFCEELWCKDVVFSGMYRNGGTWESYLDDLVDYLFLA